jgi:integrase
MLEIEEYDKQMALVLKQTSKWWYARLSARGKLRQFPLTDLQAGSEVRIPVEGHRPTSLKKLKDGDRVFQMSYARAKAAHDRLKENLSDGKAAEDLAEKLLDASTGESREKVLLVQMPQLWVDLPRKKDLSDTHKDSGIRILKKFVEFVQSRKQDCKTLEDVPAGQVEAYLRSLARRGLSPRTWNFHMGLLKHAFRELAPRAPAYRNFLEKTKPKDENTIHREPFTDAELELLLNAAREDEVLRGPVIVSAFTGLRKGDACTLEWSTLDKKKGFLQVQTRKTGETALIPLFPALADELARYEPNGKYVFKRAAELYKNNDMGELQKRFNQIMQNAGFDVSRNPDAKTITRADIPLLSREETNQRVETALKENGFQERKKLNMIAVYHAYADGQSVKQVAKALGKSVSTVSIHLNSLEEMTGCAIFRGGNRKPTNGEAVAVRSEDQEGRVRRASVKGWHSLRTSFVTRALQAGMPEELLRKITGHATVDVVREHYFNPSDEVLAAAFEKVAESFTLNTPSELINEPIKGNPLDAVAQSLRELADNLSGMDAKTFRREKEKLIRDAERVAQKIASLKGNNNESI